MLTGSDRTGVDAVDGDTVCLTKLFGPYTYESFVGSLGCGIHRLAGHAEARTSGGDEHDATTLGKVGLGSLSQENRATDVAVEVGLVKLRGGVDEVGFVTLSSAGNIELALVRRSDGALPNILVNDDLNLASIRYLQSGVDEKRNLIEVADVRFAQDGFRSDLFHIVNDLLRTLRTAFGHIVDDDVGAPLGEKDCNASTKAAGKPLSAG